MYLQEVLLTGHADIEIATVFPCELLASWVVLVKTLVQSLQANSSLQSPRLVEAVCGANVAVNSCSRTDLTALNEELQSGGFPLDALRKACFDLNWVCFGLS